MQGKVINLSADRLTDEKTGMPYYLAQIELTPDSTLKLGEMELLPGMPAEVLINTGERTVFEYLMQPITNAFARSFIEDWITMKKLLLIACLALVQTGTGKAEDLLTIYQQALDADPKLKTSELKVEIVLSSHQEFFAMTTIENSRACSN